MSAAALRALLRHLLCYYGFSAVITVICRDPVTPPELSGNTPVSDIVCPVEVGLFHSLRDQLDVPVLYSFYCGLDQFIHPDKPLLLDHGLDGCLTSVMGTYIMSIIFNPYKESHLIQFLYNGLSCCITVHTAELAAVFIDGGIIIQNIDLRQIVTLSNLKVIRVMGRCDLNYTGTKLSVNISICNDRDLSVDNREHQLLSNDILISVIIGMDCYCSITKHGLRSCSRKLKESCGAYGSVILDQRVLDMPEMACLLFIFYLGIRNGGITYRTPVDDPAALVDPAFFVHLAEYFGNCLIAALVHGKTLSVPVTGGAKLFQLFNDPSAVLSLPLPGSLKEPFSAKIFLADAFFLQLFNDLNLCSDAGMVCSWLPECIIALHPLITDQDILHGIVKGMSHMELSCDIRRGNYDRKRCFGMIHLCMEVFLRKPFVIDSVLNPLGIVGLCKFSAHHLLLFCLKKESCPEGFLCHRKLLRNIPMT